MVEFFKEFPAVPWIIVGLFLVLAAAVFVLLLRSNRPEPPVKKSSKVTNLAEERQVRAAPVVQKKQANGGVVYEGHLTRNRFRDSSNWPDSN